MQYKGLTGVIVLFITVIVLFTGCERSTDTHNGHIEMYTLIIRDRTHTALPIVGEWTWSDGWNVEVIYELSESAEDHQTRVSLGFEVYDEDGNQLTLEEDGEFSIRYRLADGATEGIIDMTLDEDLLFHGDHVHIYGLELGETMIEFLLWHWDHVDAATDPVIFRVVE